MSDESAGADAPDEDGAASRDTVVFKVLRLESVIYDLSDTAPTAHLVEAESPFRYLVIPLGLSDAVALHHAHVAIAGRRPGTHELMTSVLAGLQAEVIAARIVRYDGGVFYAELDVMTARGRQVFDCRTSDALTLALRQGIPAPILCAEGVLEAYYA